MGVRKPDFFLIGAAKAGTSSLFQYLVQHPRVFIPSIKEIYFFSDRAPPGKERTLEQYLESQPLSNGNNPDATVCFESMSGSGLDAGKAVVGDQITVYLETPFSLVPIFGVGDITLSARTTMRLEQKPTHPGISGAVLCT